MKSKFLVLILAIGSFHATARTYTMKEKLSWDGVKEITSYQKTTERYFYFKSAQLNAENDYLPELFKLQAISNFESIQSIEVVNAVYERFDQPLPAGIRGLKYITDDIQISFDHTTIRKKRYGTVTIVPLRKNKNSGQIEKLISIELSINTGPSRSNSAVSRRRQKAASSSVLATGTWYRIGVTDDGIYKITYDFLENLGVDMATVDPINLRLYGNGAGMLPEENIEFRYDDLMENAITIVDGGDGTFDKGDYFLFFGQSPHQWEYDDQESVFRHMTHRYSDTTYYFLTADLGPGKRIQNQASSSSPKNLTVTSFSAYEVHDVDALNLVKSGRDWWGETFDAVTSRQFSFNFPNIIPSEPVDMKVRAASKSKQSTSFIFTANGTPLEVLIPSVSFAYPSPGGAAGIGRTTFSASSPLINVNVQYQKILSSSRGWLDYIELNARRNLVMAGNQMSWRDARSVGSGNVSEFVLTGVNPNTEVWDVSDPLNVKKQLSSGGVSSTFSFVASTSELKEFIAVNSYLETARGFGRVENQNLHSIGAQNMVIVTHPLFESAANRLADFHRDEDGFEVTVVTPQEIYNEFSCGSQDAVAIRSFLKMIYDRATGTDDTLKYVLMFGDGSYDNKYRISGNTNFVPTYQSIQSFSLTTSYVSDDYYGILDEDEGDYDISESIDVGFGRIPVQTAEEAMAVVNKIIRYKAPNTMRDWRNIICFVADDEDFRLHMNQANNLADTVAQHAPVFNLDKIFLDAYQQVSTPGGQRYPEAEKALNQRVNQGALILNYTGHGGETGWAHETLLEIPDINSWENIDQLPLFVTATCEFSRFDDPKRISGGEYILLNPNGGGIALFTTVRTVFAGDNFELNKKLYRNLFNKVNDEHLRLGDIFSLIKNLNKTINTRNFTLLGDPALRLNFPEHDVQTTSINGQDIANVDTVRALDKVTITGYVADKNGNKLSSYNGLLYPTIFDKASRITTLNNDDEGAMTFELQNNKLFKGKVSVKSGEFAFSFIIPKDISYEFGEGKVSYYAENGVEDGNGYFNDIIIGGTSSSAVADNRGPTIELFMNDENFIFGGITDENPILLAKLSDEHGINMVGTGLGHDITAILDKNSEDAIILNDFYEADVDQYQSGSIQYPFNELSEGKHTLSVKAWDVYNNSSEKTIEFVVEKSREIEIANVLNYPNPFTTRTEFWFEHNQPSRVLDVKVQIFTVSGKLVKTIDRIIQTEGFSQNQINPIVWNGKDDYGDKIGRGVYIYKLVVRSRNNGSSAEKIEKLVIL